MHVSDLSTDALCAEFRALRRDTPYPQDIRYVDVLHELNVRLAATPASDLSDDELHAAYEALRRKRGRTWDGRLGEVADEMSRRTGRPAGRSARAS